MRIEELDYDLPRDMIAQHPSGDRSQSRLLTYDRESGRTEHRSFSDIPGLIEAGDVLVINDSRVFPARLDAVKTTGGIINVLLVRHLADGTWECLARGIGRSRAPVPVHIGEHAAELKRDNGLITISFNSPAEAKRAIERYGRMPLPPYIKRNGKDAPYDFERYQTVYAQNEGSIAAPTAGFHFSKELLSTITAKGIDIVKISLHIGVGTFSLIHSETVESHHMHGEYYELGHESAAFLKKARAAGRRIVACGTSSVRTLETFFGDNGRASLAGKTELFIYPGYHFKAVDALITNFHLPRSTPLMLVAAFMGTGAIMEVYREAIAENYRFYSYGDAMFIS